MYLGIDPVTRKKRWRSRTYRGGARGASTALSQLVSEVTAEHAVPPTEGTFGWLLDQWLRVAELDRAETTVAGYRHKIDTTLRPALGDIELRKLTGVMLSDHYQRLLTVGTYATATSPHPQSPASVRQVHAIAHCALGWAVEQGYLPSNPADRATQPARAKIQRVLPDVAAMADAVRAYAEVDPIMTACWWVTAALGSRRGESLGLTWADVDLEAATVTIRQSVVEVKGRKIVKDTKTHQARRVSIDEATVAVLASHRARVDELAAVARVTITPESFVFSPPSSLGVKAYQPTKVSRTWRAWADQQGLEGVRLHDLRHLAASVMISAGHDITTISRRLGHERVSTTLDIYSHLMPGSDEAAADSIGAAMAPKAPGRAQLTKGGNP